jgi:hypothetical protein
VTDPDRVDTTAQGSTEPATYEQSTATPQQPAARLPRWRVHTAWLAAALSLIGLAGVSAVLIAVAGRAGTPHFSSSPTPGQSAAVGATPAIIPSAKSGFPSAAEVATSGGAIGLPDSMRSLVISWQSGAGGTNLTAVTSLFGTALQLEGLRQYPLMKTTCTELARSVVTAKAEPPIPVASMQMVYLQALGELATGAADCQAAITVRNGDESLQVHVDTALLGRSAAELAAGSRDIFRSTAEIVIASRASQ